MATGRIRPPGGSSMIGVNFRVQSLRLSTRKWPGGYPPPFHERLRLAIGYREKDALRGCSVVLETQKTYFSRHQNMGRKNQQKIPPEQWNDWHWQFRNRRRTADEITETLDLGRKERLALGEVVKTYRSAATPYYISLMDAGDPLDPILRQCVPDTREITSEGGVEDPLEERAHSPVPGLIHRFRDRCLVVVTNRCAVYCRHCNRKRLWREREKILAPHELTAVAGYIEKRPAIREVILSGGDPLTLSDGRLERILARLQAIEHVEVLRIGSRMPVVLPMRITERLCGILRRYRPLWFLTQFNHPREITPEAAAACGRLLEAGIPVLNQSVLLKGINDDFGSCASSSTDSSGSA